MTYFWLLTFPRSTTVAGNCECMIRGKSLLSLRNYLSFLQVTFWSWSKFFFLIRVQTNHSRLLMFQFAQQVLWADQTVIFCLCKLELASPHHIWLVSKVLMYISSNRLETLNSLAMTIINFLGILSIIFCSFRRNLVDFMLSWPQVRKMDQTVIFCLCRHELISLHHIWLVSKILIDNSFDRMSWNGDLLSNGINWFYGIITDTFLHLLYKYICCYDIRCLNRLFF